MANWAHTSYRIEGNFKDLQELIDLCKAFLDKKRPVMDKGASVEWEGNIILALGIELGTSYIRGFIQSYELVDGILYIEAEEAWGATDFRHLLEGHYENMKVYYMVEEEDEEILLQTIMKENIFHVVLPFTLLLMAMMSLRTLKQKPKLYSMLLNC